MAGKDERTIPLSFSSFGGFSEEWRKRMAEHHRQMLERLERPFGGFPMSDDFESRMFSSPAISWWPGYGQPPPGLAICPPGPTSPTPGMPMSPFPFPGLPPSPDSRLEVDDKKFKVMVDVNQFSPEEVKVKTVGNYVVVHARHEEKQDEHGFIQREFTRKYMLPEGVDPEKVTSSLATDGVLTVEAPTQKALEPAGPERSVPIKKQDKPAVEGKK
ncbi:alpha-crystallin B chain-like [Branchiostoma floridae]|uniref:Alpha-crystallin B chain-like n=1 Tax=Branchiostoma floridae TaxID=7739 RepID=C3XVI4_BRAFL|nr:alpha-crystallin B chain-like [Branchiostoma floridae]|eukprot:XP_002612101.1 hypothetical protein BRAFLDRAFT_130908 [Branchiostoma floridae]